MAGPTLHRIRSQAHRFAEALLDPRLQQSCQWRSVPLGSASFRLGVDRSVELGRLIDGAFLRTERESAEYQLAVLHQEGTRLPNLHWARQWIEQRCEVPETVAHPYRILFDSVTGIIYILDSRNGHAVVWLRQPAEIDERSFITPFRILLSWLSDLLDMEVVHASAAVVDGCGIAFSAPSGSGKSTVSIALGLNGDKIIADDCVIVDSENVYAVYARAKIEESSHRILGISFDDTAIVTKTPGTKRVLRLESMGESFCQSAPLTMWMNPALSPRSDFYRISARRMHRLLMTDSGREIFGGTPRNHLRLGRLAWRVPSFRLLLSPEMSENVSTIHRATSVAPHIDHGNDIAPTTT